MNQWKQKQQLINNQRNNYVIPLFIILESYKEVI